MEFRKMPSSLLANSAKQDAEYMQKLQKFLVPKFYVPVLVIAIISYLPELAFPTFSNDYFYDIAHAHDKFYAYTSDGRYLSEAIRHIFGGIFPPSFVLILGLACLAICGIIVCILFKIDSIIAAIIVCGMFTTFPMLFEMFSYPSIRFFVPLAALLAMCGILVSGNVAGSVLLFLALNLYQSSIYLFAIITVYASAARLNDGYGIVALAREFIIPRVTRVLLAVVAYALFLLAMSHLLHLGGERLGSFVRYASNIGEAASTARLLLSATLEFYTQNWFTFSVVAKYAFILITILLFGALAARRNLLGLFLVLIAPLLAFGAAWIMYPAHHMLFDRILFAFVGVYAGTFATAWVSVRKYKGLLAGLGVLTVAIFVYQANVWHLYMDLRNRADLDLTRAIADRIKSLPDFKPKMPLVVVGNIQDKNYLPYRIFDTTRGIIGNTMLTSMYAKPWASDRALIFFVDFRNPSTAEISSAKAAAQGMPVWPAIGAVEVRDQIIVVRLQ